MQTCRVRARDSHTSLPQFFLPFHLKFPLNCSISVKIHKRKVKKESQNRISNEKKEENQKRKILKKNREKKNSMSKHQEQAGISQKHIKNYRIKG